MPVEERLRRLGSSSSRTRLLQLFSTPSLSVCSSLDSIHCPALSLLSLNGSWPGPNCKRICLSSVQRSLNMKNRLFPILVGSLHPSPNRRIFLPDDKPELKPGKPNLKFVEICRKICNFVVNFSKKLKTHLKYPKHDCYSKS